jgi:multisubunit Na+/H+ antiporter MnhB subunit
MSPDLVLDGLLMVILLWLAWASLASRDLFRGIVLFIAFGLVLAMVWVRLGAPDVGLAEAAIGAGLTGALLLATWGRLPRSSAGPDASESTDGIVSSEPGILICTLVGAALAFVLAGIGLVLMSDPVVPGLHGLVESELAISGADNPVTAVLLNFRGYDTLLEIAVLTSALVGVWALGPAPRIQETSPSPMLVGLNSTLMPLILLVCAYLLWVGKAAPGGAFQAGAVLAAAGVLYILSGREPRLPLPHMPIRIGAVVGLAVFVGVGIGVMGSGRVFLQYPTDLAGALILLVEAAATLSIAVILAALFIGGRPEGES